MAVPRLDTGRSYFEFTCLTCRRASRRYYVVQFVTDEHVDIEKAGQYPRPRLPRNRHVQRFMADDAANYEKAIACLANAYGIGAFAYYRRLVEDNIGRLLELVQEDAAASSSGTETLAALKQLGTNCPMAEKIKIANDAVPAHLKPDGLNPLGRLYGALSEGIHSLSETPNLIYTRAAYESTEFRTLDDKAIDKPSLVSATTHVAIRPQSVRYLNNPDELILAEYPVDPESHVSIGLFSLLVDNQGTPLYTSSNRIGIKAAFLSDASGNVIAPEEYHKRGYDDQVHGPVPYVQIEGPMNSRTGSAEDGSFRLAWYDLPCPLVSYMIDGWSVAKFQSRRFNPKLSSFPAPYFLIKPYTVFCLPQTYLVPFLGPYPIGPGEHSVSPMKIDYVVDTVALSGTAHMARLDGSMIAAEETTRYSHQVLAAERELSDYYDFDGDDTHDQVVEGYWREETGADGEVNRIFETENLDGVDESLLLQGVYLSSGSGVPGEDDPDFTRALDWQSNFQHEGMVDAIGVEDLKNTDMYVFRLADGKLISERLGLSDQEGNWSEELGVDQEGSSFFYHNYLRGYSGDVGRLTQAGSPTSTTSANGRPPAALTPSCMNAKVTTSNPVTGWNCWPSTGPRVTSAAPGPPCSHPGTAVTSPGTSNQSRCSLPS